MQQFAIFSDRVGKNQLLLLSLPANTYSEQDDAGGFHGVVRGQNYPPVVDAPFECRVRWATNREVPFKQVVLENIMGNLCKNCTLVSRYNKLNRTLTGCKSSDIHDTKPSKANKYKTPNGERLWDGG